MELGCDKDQKKELDRLSLYDRIECQHQKGHGNALLQRGKMENVQQKAEMIHNTLHGTGRVLIDQPTEADGDKDGDGRDIKLVVCADKGMEGFGHEREAKIEFAAVGEDL